MFLANQTSSPTVPEQFVSGTIGVNLSPFVVKELCGSATLRETNNRPSKPSRISRIIPASQKRHPPQWSPTMALEKEWLDRAEAISTAILQLRDSL